MESREIATPNVQSFYQTEINWDKLNKTKFYVVGAGIFSGVTLALYPLSLVKTRLQVASNDVLKNNAFSTFRNILKVDGVPGLYRGFGTVITGAIPARIVFLTSLETIKAASLKLVEPFKLSEPVRAAISNGIAGMSASLCSQAVFVPVDVVSQKLMVQGYSGFTKYNGGFDVVQHIIKTDGIRGLYRGFGLSVITYSPSSAVWWASYGTSQQIMWKLLSRGNDKASVPSQWKIVCVQAAGGVMAGAMTSCITTPLDTIKTRLQVMNNMNMQKQNIREVIKRLISEDGWRGFYRGLGPRFLTMSAWGSSMIVSYEYLKRICLITEDTSVSTNFSISSSFFKHQLLAMLSPKRLVEKAKKGLPLMRANSRSSSCDINNIIVADKGHFVVYSMDDARFVVPLSFLKSCIFQELLKVSAEEFGLPGEGPITLACSGVFMEYVVSLLKRSLPRDVEMTLLASIDANGSSDSSLVGLSCCDQQRVVC